jgi:sphingolipid delta-4 desaturase
VLGLVCLQLVSAVLLRDASWPAYLFFAWVLGGTISHSLSLANHELSHGLCFESFLPNEILGMIANIAQVCIFLLIIIRCYP